MYSCIILNINKIQHVALTFFSTIWLLGAPYLPVPPSMCSQDPITLNSILQTTSAMWPNTIIRQHVWRTSNISTTRKFTLAHFGLHSNCFTPPPHHAVCPWVWPTRLSAHSHHLHDPMRRFIKTSAGANLIPAVWWLSYPAVTHNKIAGQRLAASSHRSKCQGCDKKAKEMSESVSLHFQSRYLNGHCSTALPNSSSSCQADSIAGRYNKRWWWRWMILPSWYTLLCQTRPQNNKSRNCTNSKHSVLYHKY